MRIHSARKNQSLVHKRNAGFTLVELMVVSTITVLLLLSVSSMLMTFLLSNAKTNISRQIKAEGNEMISQLEFVFRNAKTIIPESGPSVVSCTPTGSGGTTLTNGQAIPIYGLETTNELKYVDAGAADRYIQLTPNRLNSTFVLADGPTITCYKDAGTGKTSVKIQFTLSRTGESSMRETFESIVQLRNS